MVEYEAGQGSLFFDASTRHGEQDSTYVAGTLGSIHSTGPDLNAQSLSFAAAGGIARPALRGTWFPDGFHGTMGELLRAVEERREPENSGRNNLESLALCFAAIQGAATGEAQEPGTVRKLPGSET
jgi:predicted dehydrogenase